MATTFVSIYAHDEPLLEGNDGRLPSVGFDRVPVLDERIQLFIEKDDSRLSFYVIDVQHGITVYNRPGGISDLSGNGTIITLSREPRRHGA